MVTNFCFFAIISRWERCTLYLSKLESPFLLFRNYLPKFVCQIWLKLAQWFWRRKFYKTLNIFLLFFNYLPLVKGVALNPRMLSAKFAFNWPNGSGEEDENVNSLQWQQQCRWQTTDKFQSEKFTWSFSSGELRNKKAMGLNGHLSVNCNATKKNQNQIFIHMNIMVPLRRWMKMTLVALK